MVIALLKPYKQQKDVKLNQTFTTVILIRDCLFFTHSKKEIFECEFTPRLWINSTINYTTCILNY